MRRKLMSLRRILPLLVLLFAASTAWAKGGEEVEFFVRAVPDRSEVVIGDSCLVSYVLYASAPFARVESDDKVKVKHARLRRLGVRREATVGRIVERGRHYYTMVWAQYVVVPERTGELTLPACKFKAVLNVPEAPRDPFEAFFGRTRSHEAKASATNEKLKLEVKEKPRRTTKELMRRGGTLM